MEEYGVSKRVIPCLDVSDGRVVKGERFIDLQDAGDPAVLAKHYEVAGADELVFLDISATHEKRQTATRLASEVTRDVFLPFAVGGGIRSVRDAQAVLDSGADKIVVNSAALERPNLLSELASHVGRQSVMLAIDAKLSQDGSSWQAYASGGREASGRDVIAWAKEGVDRGAGEILVTSMDRDGTNKGYDIPLLRAVADTINVPVIASGGAGRVEHFAEAINKGGADAVLCASTLHYGDLSIAQIKNYLSDQGIAIRPVEQQAGQLGYEASEPRPRLALVDYGMGNRASIKAALTRVGAEVVLTDDAEDIIAADGLVLPGVGAFPAAMERLERSRLLKPLNEFRALGKPILGICLGHQLAFESSQEAQATEGLGWIQGKVVPIKTDILPNIGWRLVRLSSQPTALTRGLGSGALFYHAHEFAAQPTDAGTILGVTELAGTAGQPSYAVGITRHENVYGTQFHPEKSSYAGLRLLKNFVDLCSR